MWSSGYQHHNQTQTSLKVWVTKWMLFKSSGTVTIRPLLLHKYLIWPQATSQSCHLRTGWALLACLLPATPCHNNQKTRRISIPSRLLFLLFFFFFNTFALFFTTKDSGGASESSTSFLSLSPSLACASQTKDIVEDKTAVNTQKAVCCPDYPKHRFHDKLIKFAEQIYFPRPNLGESSQGKQFSCLDHHQCSEDEEPGVFQRPDLILTNYSFLFLLLVFSFWILKISYNIVMKT